MRRRFDHLLLVGLLLSATAGAAPVEFDADERALIALHGPWPEAMPADSSNRVSENAGAIRLGERLFFDHALGVDSKLSCASCHDPGKAFADGRSTGMGRVALERHTPTLLNLKASRWYGWGGAADSLWAQSIRPILSPEEMGATPAQVKALLEQPAYREKYRAVFDAYPDLHAEEQVLVNVAKALAAYQETLVSERSPFDDFRDALVAGDTDGMTAYPQAAQRGLKLFIGEGRCNLCHFGPRFTNGEFSDVGIPYFTPDGVDSGRYDGIKQLGESPFNLLGSYNDGDTGQNAISTRHVQLSHRNWGEFKVPSLRSIASSAPYMHNGSLATLGDVVRHYSDIDPERLHSDGDTLLQPLNLTDNQIEDLVAFLESLGDE